MHIMTYRVVSRCAGFRLSTLRIEIQRRFVIGQSSAPANIRHLSRYRRPELQDFADGEWASEELGRWWKMDVMLKLMLT